MSTAVVLKIVVASLGLCLGTVLLIVHVNQKPAPPPVKSALEHFQMNERQKAFNQSTVVVRPDAQMK